MCLWESIKYQITLKYCRVSGIQRKDTTRADADNICQLLNFNVFADFFSQRFSAMCLHQAPVVQRPISCSPGLKSFSFELFQSIFSDNFPHLPFAHLPLYTLFAPPPPPPPPALKKNCISMVFNFSWLERHTQEKWKAKAKVMQNLAGGGRQEVLWEM